MQLDKSRENLKTKDEGHCEGQLGETYLFCVSHQYWSVNVLVKEGTKGNVLSNNNCGTFYYN